MTALLKKLFGQGETEEEEIPADEDYDEEAEAESDEPEGTEEDYGGELAVDMYQDKNNVVIKSTIAGVQPEDLDITLASDMVSIKGHRQQEQEIKEQDYYYQECYWGGFQRSLQLPVEVNVDKAEAEIRDGVLTLKLPKAARARTKKVKVKIREE